MYISAKKYGRNSITDLRNDNVDNQYEFIN